MEEEFYLITSVGTFARSHITAIYALMVGDEVFALIDLKSGVSGMRVSSSRLMDVKRNSFDGVFLDLGLWLKNKKPQHCHLFSGLLVRFEPAL